MPKSKSSCLNSKETDDCIKEESAMKKLRVDFEVTEGSGSTNQNAANCEKEVLMNSQSDTNGVLSGHNENEDLNSPHLGMCRSFIRSLKDLEEACTASNRRLNYHFNPGPVPDICKTEDCILGIDEAGRGPVLGPMVYGVAFVPKSLESDLKATECDDSKALTEQKRERIFEDLCSRAEKIGWEAFVISSTYISNRMLQRQKTSLNEISHSAAIELVERALNGGAKITEIYVDTVGPAEKYQAKLQEIFPAQTVTVRSKADSIYPVVGAASIVAKVTRDVALRTWDMTSTTSQCSDLIQWGSGYPNDPVTKSFLSKTLNPVFGFDDIVRFSWSTAEKIMDESAVKVDWEDEELRNKNKGNTRIKNFFTSVDLTGRERHKFLKDRQLSSIVEF